MPEEASILLVDDEENLRWSLALILRRAGYAVTTAANVIEARQHLQNGAFDLAFLDLKLPGISGLEVLPEMRRQYPEMQVLILTAHDKLEAAVEAVRNGARDYLLKPIDPLLIVSRVKEILEERQQPGLPGGVISHLQGLLEDPPRT